MENVDCAFSYSCHVVLTEEICAQPLVLEGPVLSHESKLSYICVIGIAFPSVSTTFPSVSTTFRSYFGTVLKACFFFFLYSTFNYHAVKYVQVKMVCLTD